jgi:hypothetical protein
MAQANVEVIRRLFDVYTFSGGECVRRQEFRERSEAPGAASVPLPLALARIARAGVW